MEWLKHLVISKIDNNLHINDSFTQGVKYDKGQLMYRFRTVEDEYIKIYINGMYHELHRRRNYWGDLMYEKYYINELLDGKQIYYNDDLFHNRIQRIDNYANGKRHGIQYMWYETNQLAHKRNYINDRLHGVQLSWYMNGDKLGESDYIDGKRHGKWIEWDRQGRIIFEKKYIDGKLVSY
jgi:antitoxin component YwqK of YwqJK toxin-antitoxin module